MLVLYCIVFSFVLFCFVLFLQYKLFFADTNPVQQGGVGLVVSNAPLLPQGTALIGDRYSQVSGEIQVSDGYRLHLGPIAKFQCLA